MAIKKTDAAAETAKPAKTVKKAVTTEKPKAAVKTTEKKTSKPKAEAPTEAEAKPAGLKGKFPTYKGRPLVRNGDTIYYGSMKEKFVTCLNIKTKKKVDDLDVADTVTVQLMNTEPDIAAGEKPIVRTSDKQGLYLALDIADAWLTRANAE